MKPLLQILKFLLLLALLAFIAPSASAFYDPTLGRWINRDPIEENDGINLFCFIKNEPVNSFDLHGLGTCCNVGTSPEWILNGSGQWVSLAPGDCSGLFTDCEGMTCDGVFVYVADLEVGESDGCCVRHRGGTPGWPSPCWNDRVWTPTWTGGNARSPGPGGGTVKHRTAPNNNPPPGYEWDTN